MVVYLGNPSRVLQLYAHVQTHAHIFDLVSGIVNEKGT